MSSYKTKDAGYILERIELDTDGCWNWSGELSHGYGRYIETRPKRHNVRAHRKSYEVFIRPLAQEAVLDHLCRNKACVNPDHLEEVAQRTNVMRGVGLTSQNAKKTHCIRGHLLDGDNIYRINGGRYCKLCTRIRNRKYKALKKASGIV